MAIGLEPTIFTGNCKALSLHAADADNGANPISAATASSAVDPRTPALKPWNSAAMASPPVEFLSDGADFGRLCAGSVAGAHLPP